MKSFRTMVLVFNWPISLTAMGVWDVTNTIGHPVANTESHAGPWSRLTEPIPHETPSQPVVFTLISPLENERQTLETLKDSSKHVHHDTTPQSTQPRIPISQAKQGLQQSLYSGLQGSSSTFNPASLANGEPRKHIPVSLFKSALRKRPVHTHGLEYQPPKNQLLHGHSSFDDNEVFISQGEMRRPSIDTDIHIGTSSTSPNQQPSRLQSERPTTAALESEKNSISKLKAPRKERTKSDDPLTTKNHEPNIEAIARYYGQNWRKEKKRKERLLHNFDAKLAQKFVSDPIHQSISPRELIDEYETQIQGFLDLFGMTKRENPEHTLYLKINMRKLLDNYLEMLSISSEVVFSNHLHTNMKEDLRDGYNWLVARLENLPRTEFDYLPVLGNTERPTEDRDFVEKFVGLSVYEGTAFWLSHRLYNSRRKRVAATYVIEFMAQHRNHWIKYLTPSSAPKLTVRTFMSFTTRVRPLKYGTENTKDAVNVVGHEMPQNTQPTLPISEARPALELSTNSGFRGSPITSNPLLRLFSPASRSQEEASLNAFMSLFRSRQLKRPFHTDQAESISSKQNTPQNPPSFNDNEGFIDQVERHRPAKNPKIHTLASSTAPNQQPPQSRFEPPATTALESQINSISKLKDHRDEGTTSNVPLNTENHQSNVKAIARYYGTTWYHEKKRKEKLLHDFDAELAQKFVSEPIHQTISPRELIDEYETQIEGFLNLFGMTKRENPEHTPYLKTNMRKLLDNYLEILSICSEVVFSNHLHTNMKEDLRDGYNWLMVRLENLPKNKFDYLPIVGNTERPSQDRIFVDKFVGRPVDEGTAFWLSHRQYNKRRERVAATYVIEFMAQHRNHWIKYLTPSSSRSHTLHVTTFMTFTNRVRPLKYSTPK
ncbi:uncharacterized protein MELLADRAFT_77811 [Melampsora larici-populina 98AG31]|uniref:Secreted protein n=1 Tax=Melampsora larici-populina (strain 98AG31 / pathotype 3-4-7) TaxID=747676 RepID=F4RM72_MELLP|nr:uncharacterized protein MELLADRAFT_77811 [Melampsora larici-populina 98AG31]EGG06371.1 hypothetical protein MELLADRAFT_77811 [Melampsora larici-populina 98AG31]